MTRQNINKKNLFAFLAQVNVNTAQLYLQDDALNFTESLNSHDIMRAYVKLGQPKASLLATTLPIECPPNLKVLGQMLRRLSFDSASVYIDRNIDALKPMVDNTTQLLKYLQYLAHYNGFQLLLKTGVDLGRVAGAKELFHFASEMILSKVHQSYQHCRNWDDHANSLWSSQLITYLEPYLKDRANINICYDFLKKLFKVIYGEPGPFCVPMRIKENCYENFKAKCISLMQPVFKDIAEFTRFCELIKLGGLRNSVADAQHQYWASNAAGYERTSSMAR